MEEIDIENQLSACEIVLEETQAELLKYKTWYSIDFLRPEISTIVLLLINNSNKTYVGFRAVGGYYLFNLVGKSYIPDWKDAGIKVTHWMPLPPSPQEIQNQKSK